MTAVTRTRLGTLIVLGVLLLAFWAADAQVLNAKAPPAEAAETLVLEGDRVVTYDHSGSPALADATRSIVQGTATADGGCEFTHTYTIIANAASLEQRELAYDPTTCRALFEVGTPAVTGSGGYLADEGGGSGNQGTKGRKWIGRFKDPINLIVNWSNSQLKWQWNANTDTVVMRDAHCKTGWLKASGWKKSYDSGCTKAYNSDHSEYKVESTKRFKNEVFTCTASDGVILKGAKTWFTDHEFVGDGYGNFTYTTTQGKSGDCAYLLHSNNTLEIY